MPRWLVQLVGERMDLEELPKAVPIGPVYATEANGSFYLVGPALEALTDVGEVRSTARAALDDYSGVIALLWPSFQKPELGAVFRESEDGQRHSWVEMSATIAGRAKVGVVLGKAGEATPGGPTQAQELLRAALSSSNLHAAVLLFSERERTWPRLFRILEEVERELGQPVNRAGLCPDAERERFRRSAQVPEVAGLDARHALGKFVPPPNPMTLHEATMFIGRTLHHALQSRI